MQHGTKTKYITLGLGLFFLYAPIVFLITYSFSESRIPGIWTRFSFKWYKEVLHNEMLINAVGVSFRIALVAATLATILGTLGAMHVTRRRQKNGLFSALMTTPLVMPEILMGLSLLLLFVALQQTIGWPAQRGFLTITIAHTTVGMSYVFLVVRSRLQEFDVTLEEAAADLGASPTKVFLKVTLPLIFPSLLSGWILSFVISLDDVVMASFLSGPGSTTLPVVIFSSVRMGITPEMNALTGIIIGAVSLIVVTLALFYKRRQYSYTSSN